LRALDQNARAARRAAKSRRSKSTESVEHGDSVVERFVFVDLEPTADVGNGGLRVKDATSLAPEWAVTSASLRPAPSFDEETTEEGDGMMLILEGIESDADALSAPAVKKQRDGRDEAERKAADLLEEARKRGAGGLVEGMDELRKRLEQGLSVLDRVVTNEEAEEAEEAEEHKS
jgi:hypothetical protein